MYAGLRLGELMGLRLEDVDLAAGLIRVEQAWDPKAKQMVAPKSKAGRRRVPIPKVLRSYLAPLKLAGGDDPTALVFGNGDAPFSSSSIVARATRVWKAERSAGAPRHIYNLYQEKALLRAKSGR